MTEIDSLNDLRRFGIEPLTGEACGIGLRVLCDVTDRGVRLLTETLGLPQLVLAPAWNHGSRDNPHVGSIMLTPDLVPTLAAVGLLQAGRSRVTVLTYPNGRVSVLALDAGDDEEAFDELLAFHLRRGHGVRPLAASGTAGLRNVHEMSGRVE